MNKQILILLASLYATSPVIAAGSAAQRAEGQQRPSFEQKFPNLVNGPKGYYHNGRLVLPVQLSWGMVLGLGIAGAASLGYAIFGGAKKDPVTQENEEFAAEINGEEPKNNNNETWARALIGCWGLVFVGFLGRHIRQVNDKVPTYEFNAQGFHKHQKKVFGWEQLRAVKTECVKEYVEYGHVPHVRANKNCNCGQANNFGFDARRMKEVDAGRELRCEGQHRELLWSVRDSSSLPTSFNEFADVMEHYHQNQNHA